jgi:hypothetical protein
MRKPLLILSVLCLSLIVTEAQEKSAVKFGKIEAKDFDIQSSLIDSSTNAIVIADIGSTHFEGNTKGWFTLVYKRFKRVKILNDKGFDAASVAIDLYSNGSDVEKLDDIKAFTYNLENGQVSVSKLESKNIFEEKYSKRTIIKKFTFPSIKAGSIIEFNYTLRSDFLFNLQPWAFQGEYPCLWSEYETNIPDFFGYVYLSQGYQPFHIKQTNDRSDYFTVRQMSGYGMSSEPIRISTTTHDTRLVMKNIPALKEEPFTTTVSNHIAKIEYQLSQYRFPNQPVEEVMGDWKKVSESLAKRENFGLAINANNNFLDDEILSITKGAKTKEEKCIKIYEFVRDNFTCTRFSGMYLEDKSLKEIFKKRSGTTAEINLLLVAMLKHESIEANPVFLSLRNRGVVHSIYPLLDRFNYVIALAEFDSSNVLLDASRRMLGYGKLAPSCNNGTAWVLDSKNPFSINISSDAMVDSRSTIVLFSNEENGKFVGTVSSTFGYYESYGYREQLTDTKLESHQKILARDLGTDWGISNFSIDSLHSKDEPINVKYDLTYNLSEDIIYLNPMFGEEIKKNPFIAAERFYPVEMPYKQSEMFVLDMEMPKGYAVEEIPKSVRYMLNEDEGMFEYICAKSAQRIQLKCRIVFNKANFPKEDYESLREFYSFIIKKQSEQIVLKKIK